MLRRPGNLHASQILRKSVIFVNISKERETCKTPRGASLAGWFLSRRDSTIVAMHEVPCSLDIWRGALGVNLCPEGGLRVQPKVSTLGSPQINEFALARRVTGGTLGIVHTQAPSGKLLSQMFDRWSQHRIEHRFPNTALRRAAYDESSIAGMKKCRLGHL